MRRLILGLLAVFILTSHTALGASTYHYGYTDTRNFHIEQAHSVPLCRSWAIPLGLSRSQPVIVEHNDGTEVFHIAGDHLWALWLPNSDINLPQSYQYKELTEYYEALHAIGILKWVRPLDPPSGQLPELPYNRFPSETDLAAQGYSHSHPMLTSDGLRIIAPGRHSLWVFDRDTGRLLSGRPDLVPNPGSDVSIVSAPLIADGNTLVVATTDGYVYALKGLLSDEPRGYFRAWLGGRISSSPSRVDSQRFAVANDGVGVGQARVYRIISAEPSIIIQEERGINTERGIPADIASEGSSLFIADKSGVLYSYHAGNSDVKRLPTSAFSTGPGFINYGPAVTDSTVYYPLRNHDREGGGPGQLLAVDKLTFTPKWKAPETPNWHGAGNTAPTAWVDPRNNETILLMGDAKGRLYAYRDADTHAEPVNLFYPPGTSCADIETATPQASLQLTPHPYRAAVSWDSGSGTGTQPTITTNLLLIGVNSGDPTNPSKPDIRNSYLAGYQLQEGLTFGLEGKILNPSAKPGETVNIQFTATRTHPPNLDNLPLLLTVNGQPQEYIVDFKDKSKVTFTMSFTRPSSPQVSLEAVLNPGGQQGIKGWTSTEGWSSTRLTRLANSPRWRSQLSLTCPSPHLTVSGPQQVGRSGFQGEARFAASSQTRTLRLKVDGTNTQVTTIQPGQIQAALNTGALIPGVAQLEISLEEPTCPAATVRFSIAINPDPAYLPSPAQVWTVRLSE